ncbi:MAG: hypothetical protein WD341_11260 [Tistlia sp.]|uniref:hypothetical protein n=1 Tax=Tistlia sp. TaxID=3057121 RepID=UPI0034A268C7
MDPDLRALVSRTVTEAGRDEGVLCVGFAHGAVVTVAWPHRLETAGRPIRDPAVLVGQRLVALSSGGDRIALDFSDGAKLTVEVVDDHKICVAGFHALTRQGRLIEWRHFDEEAA